MVSHQAISGHLPGGLRASFGQRFEEAKPVRVVSKDRLAAITTIHHMAVFWQCAQSWRAQPARQGDSVGPLSRF